MSERNPFADTPDAYPVRDSVQDLDPATSNRTPADTPAHQGQAERQRQERGNRGPDEQPGFGEGA